jgi:hypothetical protein
MFGKYVNIAALASAMIVLALPNVAHGQQTLRVYQAAGPKRTDIVSTVEGFRVALGTLNANDPGSEGSGRREINWDGVPDNFADPNAFPGDFFNAPVSGRARGAEFITPGSGFLVSANAVNPTNTPIEFGRLNRTYPRQFATFSRERLFTAVGSNVVEVHFFIPGTDTRAVTTGFGAVFTDVDLPRSTKIEYFGRPGNLLRRQEVPEAPGAQSLSFAGVVFNRAQLWRVRITSGSSRLGPNDAPDAGRDIVVMDDFIFGEPR